MPTETILRILEELGIADMVSVAMVRTFRPANSTLIRANCSRHVHVFASWSYHLGFWRKLTIMIGCFETMRIVRSIRWISSKNHSERYTLTVTYGQPVR